MVKKIICLAISLIMLFSLAACRDMQNKFDELQKEIELLNGKIDDLKTENEQKNDKIANLENEFENIKNKDDFVLSVTVDPIVINKGDAINVNAILHNQSGKGCYIGYASPQKGWFISDGWLQDDFPDLSGTFHYVYFGKDNSMPFSYNIPVGDQEVGLYELHIEFIFILFEKFNEKTLLWNAEGVPITINSDKISIFVIN